MNYNINRRNSYPSYPMPYNYVIPYQYYQIPTYNSENYRKVMELKDYGPEPFIFNIEKATKRNTNYRTALWTGNHLQVTLMSIVNGGDIGLEIHPNVDQFIRIEEGQGLAKMGDSRDNLNFQQKVFPNDAIIIPAGTWHNIINTGYKPLKLYSIYAPPQHPRGTVQKTKEEAMSSNNWSQRYPRTF